MKISTKPMSSPSRTEKFPPPLMRFLRSNVGSRSRGRSRSSPMFVRKKNAVIEAQEPSSPKVTCIGQVRVRRSSKQSGKKSAGRSGRTKPSGKGLCSCCWVRKTLYCTSNAKRLRPRSFRPVWRKCLCFFRFGYCRRPKNIDESDDSPKLEPNRTCEYKANDTEDEDKGFKEEDEAQTKLASPEAFCSSSPPKNALLLTRCRSAPYRSSSLASRFWGSPLLTSQAEDDNGEETNSLQHREDLRDRVLNSPPSESEPTGRDSTSESKIEMEGSSINGKTKEELELEEGGESGRPLILTRCKSEPARTGERLIPEASLWRRERGLGLAAPRPPGVCD